MDDDPHDVPDYADYGGHAHTHVVNVDPVEPHRAQVAVWVFGAIVLFLIAVVLVAGITWAVVGLASGQIDLPS